METLLLTIIGNVVAYEICNFIEYIRYKIKNHSNDDTSGSDE